MKLRMLVMADMLETMDINCISDDFICFSNTDGDIDDFIFDSTDYHVSDR